MTTWYVATGGSDGGTGAVGDPFATIAHALSVAVTNDTITLRAGTYNQQYVNSTKNGITLNAYSGETVYLKGVSNTYYIVDLNGVDDCVVEGLYITYNTSHTLPYTKMPYVIIRGSGDGCIVRNNFVYRPVVADYLTSWYSAYTTEYNTGRREVGIQVTGGSNHEIDSNELWGVNKLIQVHGCPQNTWIHDNYCHHPVQTCVDFTNGAFTDQNTLVENNILEHAFIDDGIQTHEQAGVTYTQYENQGIIIRNNVMRYNGENGCDLKSAKHVIVEGNIFYGNYGSNNGFYSTGYNRNTPGAVQKGGISVVGCRQVIIRNNTMYDNASGTRIWADTTVYNNTLIWNQRDYLGSGSSYTSSSTPQYWGIFQQEGDALTNVGIKNNIIANHPSTSISLRTSIGSQNMDLDYNAHVNNLPSTWQVTSWTLKTEGQWETLLAGLGWTTDGEVNSFFGFDSVADLVLINVPEHPTGDHDDLDFGLGASSPLLAAGGWLTKANGSGSGSSSLVVDNPFYFMDGMGVVTGDTIYIEGVGTRTISAINYSTKTITLSSSATWADNAKIYWGSSATPNIGAETYAAGSSGPPPGGEGTGEPEETGCSFYTSVASATPIPITLNVTKFGALVEVDPEDLLAVTKFGVLVEIGDDSIKVTKFGVLAEIEIFIPMPTYFPPPVEWARQHFILPEPLTGYQLDNGGSFWSVVVPQRAVNYVATPSFQQLIHQFLSIINWDDYERSSEQASRGFHSLKLIPDPGLNGQVTATFYPQETGFYTFSLDIYLHAGQEVDLQITNSIQTVTYASATVIANETGWKRYNLTYLEKALAARWMTLRFPNTNNDDSPLYTDGWMIVAGKEEQTYFDGDTREDAFGADPYSYAWTGSPHLSYSVRGNRLMSGGFIRSFYDLDFRTTSIVGLGMGDSDPDLVLLSDGEEILRGNRTGGKEFSIIGTIFGRNVYELQRKHQGLIDYLNRLNSTNGGITLIYQGVNGRGVPLGQRLFIKCAFTAGLSGQYDNNYQEILELRFRLMDGKVTEEFGQTADLELGYEPDPLTYIYAQNPHTGEWDSYAVGSNATIGGEIHAALLLDTGQLVVGGTFTAIGGVTARRLAIWSPWTKTWAELGGGVNAAVFQLALGRGDLDGQVIVAGQFTATVGGALTMRRLAAVTIYGSWTELGSGLDDQVNVLLVDPLGRVYVSGSFTADNSANTLHNFAYYDARIGGTDSYHDLLTDNLDGPINKLVLSPDGYVYIGGQFAELNTVVDFNAVAKFNPELELFPLLAYDDMNTGLDALVHDMVLGADGYLYVVGTFTTEVASSSQVRSFARWTGTVWEEVGGDYFATEPWRITADRRGNFYLNFEPISDAANPESFGGTQVYGWNGSSWFPPDFRKYLPIEAPTENQFFSQDGRFFVPTLSTGDTILSGHTEINYTGSADAQVKLQIVGPCIVHRITNWTTGKAVYFRAFELGDGEEFVLDLTTSSPKAYTNLRPNLLSYIVTGSSNMTDFRLVPGINHITLLTGGVDNYNENTKAVLAWNNQHWTIDAGLLALEDQS